MNRLLRSPSLHFLLIGAILFIVQTGADGRREPAGVRVDRAPVVVTAAHLAEMREQYQQAQPGEPDREAYDYMIKRFVDDEILYREALALGMDRGDQTVRYRLVEKMEYLGESSEGDDEDGIVDRAIELGLSRSDGLVRGAMIQKYRMLVRFARSVPPTEQQLLDYYEANKNDYARPARVSLAHVYFSNQDRGRDAAVEDATRALSEITAKSLSIDDAIAGGDVFLMGHQFGHQSERAVGQLFGAEFAREIMNAEQGGWHGPTSSSFGSHLVFVKEATAAGILEFESVRNRVLKAVEDEMREEQLQKKIAELRSVYDVVIEWDKFNAEGAS